MSRKDYWNNIDEPSKTKPAEPGSYWRCQQKSAFSLWFTVRLQHAESKRLICSRKWYSNLVDRYVHVYICIQITLCMYLCVTAVWRLAMSHQRASMQGLWGSFQPCTAQYQKSHRPKSLLSYVCLLLEKISFKTLTLWLSFKKNFVQLMRQIEVFAPS